jgi:predicted RNA binding protein YcfA (HicA-like mRNA interferase family)
VSVLSDISGPQALKAFRKAGWIATRQSGSHVSLAKAGERELIVIPVHGARPLKRGLLLAAIRKAGLTPDEFRRLL